MRRAMTRTEVLVLLAILAALLTLLFCGIQRVRLMADQNGCKNNLLFVWQGLQQHHDVKKKFPPGYISESDAEGKDTGSGWGWAANMLPYQKHLNTGERIDFTLPIEHRANSQLTPPNTFLNFFYCPAEPAPSRLNVAVGPRDANGQLKSTTCEPQPSNYVGNYGDSEPGPGAGTGVFFRNSAVRLSDITDGASSTLMVGERSFKYGDATWVGAVTGSNLSAAPDSGLPTTPKHASSYVLGHTGGATEGLRRPLEVNHFSSAHYGGANFLFADGSVRFLSSSVDYRTLKALSTRAGGEKELGDF